jgi:hypothetical protein
MAHTVAAVLPSAKAATATEQPASQGTWTATEITAARLQLRDYSSAGNTLEERLRQALSAAPTQRLRDFWIVYTFTTPTHADGLMLNDTREGSFSSASISGGRRYSGSARRRSPRALPWRRISSARRATNGSRPS